MLSDLWLRDEHCDRLCHISGVQRSVVRVGRVVARFNKTKERMAISGIEAKVADQTWGSGWLSAGLGQKM